MSAADLRTHEREAIAWVIRTRDPSFGDWEAFTCWLEGAPERAVAYDTFFMADDELAEVCRGLSAPVRAERGPEVLLADWRNRSKEAKAAGATFLLRRPPDPPA